MPSSLPSSAFASSSLPSPSSLLLQLRMQRRAPSGPVPTGPSLPRVGKDTLAPGPSAPLHQGIWPLGNRKTQGHCRPGEPTRSCPARPSGVRAPAAPPHPLLPPVPRQALPLSAAARTVPPRERGSGEDRSATRRGLGSLLGSFLRAGSKREARANSGGVSPNKPSQQRGARPLRRPAPPGAPEHPPLPIGSAAGGAWPYIKAELGGSRRG